MPHRRSSMRTVPRLFHGTHMAHNLVIVRFRYIASDNTHTQHLVSIHRHANHDTFPASPRSKHGARFATSDRLTIRSVSHQVNELFKIWFMATVSGNINNISSILPFMSKMVLLLTGCAVNISREEPRRTSPPLISTSNPFFLRTSRFSVATTSSDAVSSRGRGLLVGWYIVSNQPQGLDSHSPKELLRPNNRRLLKALKIIFLVSCMLIDNE